jgi:hypothetical protein
VWDLKPRNLSSDLPCLYSDMSLLWLITSD